MSEATADMIFWISVMACWPMSGIVPLCIWIRIRDHYSHFYNIQLDKDWLGTASVFGPFCGIAAILAIVEEWKIRKRNQRERMNDE